MLLSTLYQVDSEDEDESGSDELGSDESEGMSDDELEAWAAKQVNAHMNYSPASCTCMGVKSTDMIG